MASPGWYPDPAGRPGAFRFWNGAEWSAELASTPYGPAPGQAGAPPPPPPSPSGPTASAGSPGGFEPYAGWGPIPGATPGETTATVRPTDSGSGHGVLIVVVAVLVAVALGIATFLFVEAVTDDSASVSSGSGQQTDQSADSRLTSTPT